MLPFGISSSPEQFQKHMNKMLSGQDGVLVVIIFGRNKQKYDIKLHAYVQKVQDAGITLNRDKCDSLIFLGHVVDNDSILPDPAKTANYGSLRRTFQFYIFYAHSRIKQFQLRTQLMSL